MNILSSNLSTRKNSVNSSLATIKAPTKDVINETINKNSHNNHRNMNKNINNINNSNKTRFSHQEQCLASMEEHKRRQRNSCSYKENLNVNNYGNTWQCNDSKKGVNPDYRCFDDHDNDNSNDSRIVYCMNHGTVQATHTVCGDSDSPMNYCQRCSILIASKGFDVRRIGGDEQGDNYVDGQNYCLTQRVSANNPRHTPTPSTRIVSPRENTSSTHPSPMIQLTPQTTTQLQQCWSHLKHSRQQNLTQIDTYINTLTSSIDFLQDYYYTLHQHIEKQKNQQLKQIIGKKHLLEQLRAEVSGVFVRQMESVKEVKERLVRHGGCKVGVYQGVVMKVMEQRVRVDFQAAVEEVVRVDRQREAGVDGLGQQISDMIRRFSKSTTTITTKGDATHANTPGVNQYNNFNQRQSSQMPHNPNPYTQYNPHRPTPTIPGIPHIDSSVRSLQLSFDNSDNNSDESPRKVTSREESNNFTLNQYINHRGEEQSFSNLLYTETDFS